MCNTGYIIESKSVMSNGITKINPSNRYLETLNISSRVYYLIVATRLWWYVMDVTASEMGT